MENPSHVPDDKKLLVIYRVEPGCLGPDGLHSIEAFCDFAQKNLAAIDAEYIKLNVVPRHDKSLPEMQYAVLDKKLNHVQAEKYLALFDKNLEALETRLSDSLSLLIDDFMSGAGGG